MILQICEGIRIGELQNYVLNLIRIIGSAFTFLCLIILPPILPRVSAFVIALNGGLLLGAAINAYMVIRRIRPNFSALGRDVKDLRHLAISGSSYFVIGIGSFFQTNVPALVLSVQHGAVSTINFSLLIRLLYVEMVMMTMFTAPFWPAIINARAQNDHSWLARSMITVGSVVTAIGVSWAILIGVFGSTVLRVWAHVHSTDGGIFYLAFGIYFLQMAWSHLWCIILMGFGRERIASIVIILEAGLIALFGTCFSLKFGATGMILGMNLALLLMSNWLLPFLVLRSLGPAEWSRIQGMIGVFRRKIAPNQ